MKILEIIPLINLQSCTAACLTSYKLIFKNDGCDLENGFVENGSVEKCEK